MDQDLQSKTSETSSDHGQNAEISTQPSFVHIMELERPRHEYHLGTSAADLPRLTGRPTLRDWDKFRPLIEDLYLHQRLPLPKVIQILAYHFNFVGTIKMFKTRLKRWDFKIYYREADYKMILESMVSNSNTSIITVNDRPVEWARVRRWVSDDTRPIPDSSSREVLLRLIEAAEGQGQQVADRDDEAEHETELARYAFAQEPQHSPPRLLSTPISHNEAPHILQELKDYIHRQFPFNASANHVNFRHASWNNLVCQSACGRPFSTTLHPSELVQDYHRGLQLMNAGRVDAGFQLVAKACRNLYTTLRQQHPALLPCLLKVLIGYAQLGSREVQQQIAMYVVEMCVVVHGTHHPLTRFCRYLYQNRDSFNKFVFLLSCGRVFTQSLGRNHTISLYLNQKVFEVLLDAECFGHALAHAKRELDPVCSEMNGLPTPLLDTHSVCFCFLRRKARLYRLIGQAPSAAGQLGILGRLLLTAVQKNTVPIPGNSVYEEIFRALAEMAQFFLSVHDLGRFLAAYDLALEVCVAVRGLEDGKTRTMVTIHQKRLSKLGLDEAAQLLRLNHSTIFAEPHLRDHTRSPQIALLEESSKDVPRSVLSAENTQTIQNLPPLAPKVQQHMKLFLIALHRFCRPRMPNLPLADTAAGSRV